MNGAFSFTICVFIIMRVFSFKIIFLFVIIFTLVFISGLFTFYIIESTFGVFCGAILIEVLVLINLMF